MMCLVFVGFYNCFYNYYVFLMFALLVANWPFGINKCHFIWSNDATECCVFHNELHIGLEGHNSITPIVFLLLCTLALNRKYRFYFNALSAFSGVKVKLKVTVKN